MKGPAYRLKSIQQTEKQVKRLAKKGLSQPEICKMLRISREICKSYITEKQTRIINRLNRESISVTNQPVPVDVRCKCPTCGIYHDVIMTEKPFITPRVYCKNHDYLRYKPEGELYSIGYGDR